MQTVGRRAGDAGLGDNIHSDQLRHIFYSWLEQRRQRGNPMRLPGWRVRTMLKRHAAITVAERVASAQRGLSPGDRL